MGSQDFTMGSQNFTMGIHKKYIADNDPI